MLRRRLPAVLFFQHTVPIHHGIHPNRHGLTNSRKEPVMHVSPVDRTHIVVRRSASSLTTRSVVPQCRRFLRNRWCGSRIHDPPTSAPSTLDLGFALPGAHPATPSLSVGPPTGHVAPAILEKSPTIASRPTSRTKQGVPHARHRLLAVLVPISEPRTPVPQGPAESIRLDGPPIGPAIVHP